MSKVQNMMTILNNTVVNGAVNASLFTENEVIRDRFFICISKNTGR